MYPTRAEVKAFGQQLQAGDVLVNKWAEHKWPAHTRVLTVVKDVPRMAMFILQDQYGKTTWMRTRTLLQHYSVVS